MAKYILPEDHLGLLQAILIELARQRDPDATFITQRELERTAEAPAVSG